MDFTSTCRKWVYIKEIMRVGYGEEEIPPITEINNDALKLGKSKAENDFGDLINFLKNESSRFQVIFVSFFGLYEGKSLGISDLLKSVLPKF